MKECKIIVVTNQKGGCGKTTISMNLAGELSRSGKVLLIDGDIQGSATRWAKNNDTTKGFPAAIINLSTFEDQAHREINKYIKNYDYIIIDCPPAMESKFANSVLLVANLAIVPVVPSPTDMWAVSGILKLIKLIQEVNTTLKTRLLISNCDPRLSNVAKLGIENIHKMNIPVFSTKIYHRAAYEHSALFGQTVKDLSCKKSKEELKNLKKEVIVALNSLED